MIISVTEIVAVQRARLHVATPLLQCKGQWYQTLHEILLFIFVRNVSKENKDLRSLVVII